MLTISTDLFHYSKEHNSFVGEFSSVCGELGHDLPKEFRLANPKTGGVVEFAHANSTYSHPESEDRELLLVTWRSTDPRFPNMEIEVYND